MQGWVCLPELHVELCTAGFMGELRTLSPAGTDTRQPTKQETGLVVSASTILDTDNSASIREHS